MVLKNGSDVSTFEKALGRAVRKKADVQALVLKRSLEIRDLDETVTREEVVAVLCLQLSKREFDGPCKVYKYFGGVQTAIVPLIVADAQHLLQLRACNLSTAV